MTEAQFTEYSTDGTTTKTVLYRTRTQTKNRLYFDQMPTLSNRISRHAASAALSFGILLLSCSGNVVRTMVPSPIVMQDERLDFSRVVLPEGRTTEVSVLFATTRAPAPPDAPERYTSRPGDAVRTGVAKVQLGEPKWSFDDLTESDRTSRPELPRPARVLDVEEFGVFGAPGSEAERQFVSAVDRQLETSRNGSVVIYVPGFRATFDQVMILMSSWAHFLARQSPVIALARPNASTWLASAAAHRCSPTPLRNCARRTRARTPRLCSGATASPTLSLS